MKVSIVYCTAREGGLDILADSVKGQTHEDFEVIVVDELRRTDWAHRIPKCTFVDPPHKKSGMYWNLSASLNAGVRAATGELIVLVQDYIWFPPDAIEKFVRRFEQEPRSIVTGVGHQYFAKNFPGKPEGECVFVDPRAEKTGFALTIPVEWEANWGSFPRQAWLDIGGFDEDFDAGWGYDNVNFAERCQLAGYHIFLDTDNEVFCYSHIRLFDETKTRNDAPNNQELWHRKYRGMHKLGEPWKLNFASPS